MSHKEIDRLMVIEQCDNRMIRQSVAARQLGISPRHSRRIIAGFRCHSTQLTARKNDYYP